jgi:hypothetical protein
MIQDQRPHLLARIGLAIKRAATFVYGPAEIRPDVDPIVQIDRERGAEPTPETRPAPRLSERQQSYQDLPRGTAE